MAMSLSEALRSFETATCEYHVVRPEEFKSDVFEQKLKSANPSLNDLVYLKNDFTLTREGDIKGVLKSFKMLNADGVFVIYKEYFEGIPLVDFLKNWSFSVPKFIALATKLTKLLQELHMNNLLVKEFVIENVLIDPTTQEVKLCSLGSASQLIRERVDFNSEFDYYGSLWHVAPEQTGRVGRAIDLRTDFYALGIMLYQILCGKKPFYYTDSMELIHAHIAKTPVQPKSIVKDMPDAFNEIVLKLMSKDAEDRYQSDSGILYDLDLCMKEWQHKGRIDNFQLGAEDYSKTFYLSEKIYGREKELTALKRAWDKSRTGDIHLYLVGGFSGIGKTRLINEIRKEVIDNKGFFLSGKYDQLNKETAFSGFIQITQSLVQNILSESDLQVDEWKEAIDKATDEDIALICELVPEVKTLVDEPLEVIDIGPVEGKKKLEKAAVDFTSIYQEMGRPAVLFLDDLQWADMASLEMLETLVKADLKNVLIIGAYRDNEVDESHPLIDTIQNIKKAHESRVTEVALSDLSEDAINHLSADSFQMAPDNTKELTKAVMNKTRGNPFFVKQFLSQLVSDNVIVFDDDVRTWIWRIREIENLQISDYAVDLLLKRMNKLSDESRRVISLAACIGNVFDFNTLATISGYSRSDLSEHLWELISEDFINSIGLWGRHHVDNILNDVSETQNTNYEFRFQHDRIQQAAYSIIPESDQQQQHYTIGKLLLTNLNEDQVKDKLFEVLNHLIIGESSIVEEDRPKFLAKLCLDAARRALRNNVIRPATTYFAFGMRLIKENQEVDFFKDLLIGQSECEYLLGNYELSEALFNRAVSNASSSFNKADILCRKMALYENTQRHARAIETAREGLAHLGMNLPKNVNQFHVLKELLTVKFYLRNKTTDQLLNNRMMESPEKKLIMKTLMNLWGPAYLLQKQELLAYKILKMVNYSVRFGNSIESALAYAFYGYVVSAQLDDYKNGCDFAKLGLELNEKLDDKSLRSKLIVIAEGCVAHWGRPYNDMLPKLREGFHVGVESNDIIYAGYACTFMNRNHLWGGMSLENVLNKSIGFYQFVMKVNAVISRQQMLPWTRLILDLMDRPPTPEIFKELSDREAYFKHISMLNDELNVQLPLASHYCSRAMYHFYMAEYDPSYEMAKKADPLMMSLVGLTEWAEQLVFKTLAGIILLQKNRTLSGKEARTLKNGVKKIKKWSEASPANYESKYLLIKAEQAILDKKYSQAEGLYQRAIASAEEHDLIHMSALAYERLSEMHFNLDQEKPALTALRKSIIDYHEWGAKRKVDVLQQKMKSSNVGLDLGDSHVNLSSGQLDLQTVLRASQTLSGEVRFDQLMEKLLLILIRNAGAQNAYLIRQVKNKLIIKASTRIEDNNKMVLRETPIDDVTEISNGVIRRAFQSGKTQIINDVDQDREGNILDLGSVPAKSLMCVPIINKGDTIAAIYLDNHVSKQVFTSERKELLEVLSGQIAISLENAELYQNLEDRVIERTQVIEKQKLELERSKKQSDDLLLNILPEEIADELKENGKCKTRKYESATIMFTDFEDFTSMSETLTPEELIEIVDEQYQAFDTITEKYGIEKIKTIGDSYMCVSGIPVANSDHAVNAVKAALEMAEFVKKFAEERKKRNLPYARMRIGMHSGTVIAGVVGHKKFAYDVWGDSVNTASRMESSCEVGKVNISGTTYELVKDKFKCVYRGKIEAKRKGEIDMFYVEG